MRARATALIGLLIADAGFFGLSRPAAAQTVAPGPDVAARTHPQYDPIGQAVGSFRLFPAVTIGVDATDNYRATETVRVSDLVLSVRPTFDLRSQWARHRVDANAYVQQTVHPAHGSENALTFGAHTRGEFDVSRATRLTAELSGQSEVESRGDLGSFQAATGPVRYHHGSLSLAAAHTRGEVTLRAQTGLDRYDYSDAQLVGGATLDQDYRDFRNIFVEGGATYAWRGGVGLVASVRHESLKYDVRPGHADFLNGVDIDRGSAGVVFRMGVTLEASRLISATLQVGYQRRNYRDTRLRDADGFSYSADVLWSPTALTSVRLTAARSIQDGASTAVAGYTRNDVKLAVNHELYRNVLVTGDLGYNHFEPNGPGNGGNEYAVGLSSRYLVNRVVSFSAGLRHVRRESASPGLRYAATRATVSLRMAL